MSFDDKYLVVRLVDALDPDRKEGVLDLSTARMSQKLTKAIRLSGAWPGSVFAVWVLSSDTARPEALDLARKASPDQACVLTDLGVIAEMPLRLVRDAEVMEEAE